MFLFSIMVVLLPILSIDDNPGTTDVGSSSDDQNHQKTISNVVKKEEIDLTFPSNLHLHQKTFSDQIITDILLRSPVITLGRFNSVSKKWNKFISSDPYFRRNYKQSPLMLGVFHHHRNKSIKFMPTSSEGEMLKKNAIPATPFDESLRYITKRVFQDLYLIASSNGILLLCSNIRVNPSCYYICNPITNKWFPLPEPTNNRVFTTGFIYNDFNQYKVVRNIWTEELGAARSHAIEILDSQMFDHPARWRKYILTCSVRFHLNVDNLAIISEKTSCVYWPVYMHIQPQGCVCDGVLMLDLDIIKQGSQQVEVDLIPLPRGAGEGHRGCKIGQVNGLIVYTRNNTHSIKMWVLHEDTQKWSLKYNVEDWNAPFISVEDFHPLYAHLLLMRMKNNKLTWYNLQSENEASTFPMDWRKSANLVPFIWPKWPPSSLLFE